MPYAIECKQEGRYIIDNGNETCGHRTRRLLYVTWSAHNATRFPTFTSALQEVNFLNTLPNMQPYKPFTIVPYPIQEQGETIEA